MEFAKSAAAVAVKGSSAVDNWARLRSFEVAASEIAARKSS